MSVREVRIWPDPALLKVSEPVPRVDDAVRALVQDLIDTMEDHGHAAGLAAPQIGVNLRVFVADIPPEHNEGNGTNGRQAFINPEILLKEGKLEGQEGCLSIPDEEGPVTRATHILLRYLDLEGNTQQVDAVNYLAVCLQHEIDHLDGKLWIDYQSPLKRELIKKKMLKLKKRSH